MIITDAWTSKFKDIDDIIYRPKPFQKMELCEGNEIAIGLRAERKWINPKEEDMQKIYDGLDKLRSDFKDKNATHSFGYQIFKL